MAAVNEPSQLVLARQSSETESRLAHILMAVAVAVVLIGAIIGIVIAASTGQSEAVLGIALIGGGLLCAAALC
jgi:uncharacterized membrane protein